MMKKLLFVLLIASASFANAMHASNESPTIYGSGGVTMDEAEWYSPEEFSQLRDKIECFKLESKLLAACQTLAKISPENVCGRDRTVTFTTSKEFNITSCLDEINKKHGKMNTILEGTHHKHSLAIRQKDFQK